MDEQQAEVLTALGRGWCTDCKWSRTLRGRCCTRCNSSQAPRRLRAGDVISMPQEKEPEEEEENGEAEERNSREGKAQGAPAETDNGSAQVESQNPSEDKSGGRPARSDRDGTQAGRQNRQPGDSDAQPSSQGGEQCWTGSQLRKGKKSGFQENTMGSGSYGGGAGLERKTAHRVECLQEKQADSTRNGRRFPSAGPKLEEWEYGART